MSVLIKLRDYRNLSAAENQVREYILKYPKKVLEYTVYDLARESFTSPATVVRLCKKIDVKGFTHLKVLLAEEIKYFQDMKLNLLDSTTIEKDDTPHAVIEKITNIAVKTIEETRVLVNEKEFMKVAHLLEKAVIIDFYGVGASHIVAMDGLFKFMRIGKNVITYQFYDRQYVQAVNSDASHVGIIISYSGETKEMLQIAGILQKNGTPVVAVTSCGENSLNRVADYNLFVTAKETVFRSGAMASRTAQLYIIDILYALYCSLHYDDTIQKIQQTRIDSADVS
ncbi:MAG: MurR/RpiR family transcriptional regulator [Lachnospiraceae bacterium]|uniref:MurR/RpiR family transcriptional regulator n=1 Tax=Candidatus Merdisoma sp. JLR.KK011 TaxID=3114299 RepID=UPI002FF1A6F1|nr:MurR/RpiR family transcriptional regulator [Lachnospiraceae bacterium]